MGLEWMLVILSKWVLSLSHSSVHCAMNAQYPETERQSRRYKVLVSWLFIGYEGRTYGGSRRSGIWEGI